jgi:hypothetical protein
MPPPHTGTETFTHDVFLSHSAKDKAVVRAVAERLRNDGLRVWFDEWELKPEVPLARRMGEGSGVRAAKIEEGLEQSKFGTRNSEFGIAQPGMSANAFGSDWAQLEAGTFRFRDPLNKERRFIPLRLDDAPIKGSLERASLGVDFAGYRLVTRLPSGSQRKAYEEN